MRKEINYMKILFVDPYENTVLHFRKELIDRLILEKHKIILCTEKTEKIVSNFRGKVLKIIDVSIDLKDTSLFSNVKLIFKYKKIIKKEKPDLILSYTIKPNLYCGFLSKRTPIIANITGLGNAFKKKNLLYKIVLVLYRKAFRNIDYVFFQNKSELAFFERHHIPLANFRVIPGSGVNTNKFIPLPINNTDCVNFLFASRAIKEKGFNLLVEAIPYVVEKNNKVHFNFLLSATDKKGKLFPEKILCEYGSYISLMDSADNILSFYHQNDFLVAPSFYREGISNVLIESLSSGRPIITTNDNPGCMETLQENINGFGVLSNSLKSLIDALIKASFLKKHEIEQMGLNGRKFVIKNFDRNIVIDTYLNVIYNINMKQDALA